MQGFITTNDGDWVFDLSDPEPPKIHDDTAEMAPILGTAEQWENFSNQRLYNWECLIREWILKHAENHQWATYARNRRYTMKMVIEEITGREYTQAEFAKDTPFIRRLLEYYSTKVQREGVINGKKYTKTIYTVSQKRVKNQKPFSLRLRLEQFKQQGVLPTPSNMKVPSVAALCKPGTAKNPRTQATMDRRSKLARERYNERYRNRKH